MTADREIERLLKIVIAMSAIEIRRYYASVKAHEGHDEFGTNLLAAVEAIADLRFPGQWRTAGLAVHHIDGNPRNNKRSNLRLVSITEHYGR